MDSFLKNTNVFFMLLVCGSQLFFKEYGIVTIPLYAMTGCWLFMRERKGMADLWNFRIVCVVILWNIVNNYVLHSNVQTNIVFSSLLCIIGAFFTISSFDFFEFRDILFKQLKFITVISIIVQLWHDFIGGEPGRVSEESYLSFYIFNTEWGQSRLASIYWEPGMYQIVIMYVLAFFTDEFKDAQNWKQNLKKYGIFIVALLYTQSTMGYICLFLLFVTIFVQNNKVQRKVFLWPVYIGVVAAVGLVLWSSEAVQKKVMQRESEVETSSYYIRLNDNISLATMTMERPFVGYGMDTSEYQIRNESLNNLSASNGWLYTSATNGIPYLLLILFFIYKGIKRQENAMAPAVVMSILLISQCNEYIVFFPYTFMYIFKFNEPDMSS